MLVYFFLLFWVAGLACSIINIIIERIDKTKFTTIYVKSTIFEVSTMLFSLIMKQGSVGLFPDHIIFLKNSSMCLCDKFYVMLAVYLFLLIF
jgi:hypothetical protein